MTSHNMEKSLVDALAAPDPRVACSNQRNHTKCPTGYIAWHEWADRKMKRHFQILCPGCNRFSIWKRKAKGTP